MERGAVAERLAGPCRAFGVRVDAAAAERLGVYVELLLDWGARINLTAARSADEILDDHIADALAVVAALPETATRLVDVGAGAGLPGVVVAVLCPELQCTLLEPRSRRWAFLREVRRELSVANLTPVQQRLEEHVSAPDFEPYDVAISRATWPVPEWLERGQALVRRGGRVIALEGLEATALPPGAIRTPYELRRRTGAVVFLDV